MYIHEHTKLVIANAEIPQKVTSIKMIYDLIATKRSSPKRTFVQDRDWE